MVCSVRGRAKVSYLEKRSILRTIQSGSQEQVLGGHANPKDPSHLSIPVSVHGVTEGDRGTAKQNEGKACREGPQGPDGMSNGGGAPRR